MKSLKDKGKIGHTQDILYLEKDVKEAVLKDFRELELVFKIIKINKLFGRNDILILLNMYKSDKIKKIFGDWEK